MGEPLMVAPTKKMLLVDRQSVAIAALCEEHFTRENKLEADARFSGSGRHWTGTDGFPDSKCLVCGKS